MQQPTQIKLHGQLGETIGREWKLFVSNVGEAIRAIEVLSHHKLYRYLLEKDKAGVRYRVLINGRDFNTAQRLDVQRPETITNSELVCNLSNLHRIDIVPVIEGAGDNFLNIFTIIAGIVLIAVGIATFGTSVPWGVALIMGGIGLAAAGVFNLLAKPPDFQDFREIEGATGRTSYLFNGPANTTREGGPVPVGYGRMLVGSQVVAASYVVQNVSAEIGDHPVTPDPIIPGILDPNWRPDPSHFYDTQMYDHYGAPTENTTDNFVSRWSQFAWPQGETNDNIIKTSDSKYFAGRGFILTPFVADKVQQSQGGGMGILYGLNGVKYYADATHAQLKNPDSDVISSIVATSPDGYLAERPAEAKAINRYFGGIFEPSLDARWIYDLLDSVYAGTLAVMHRYTTQTPGDSGRSIEVVFYPRMATFSLLTTDPIVAPFSYAKKVARASNPFIWFYSDVPNFSVQAFDTDSHPSFADQSFASTFKNGTRLIFWEYEKRNSARGDVFSIPYYDNGNSDKPTSFNAFKLDFSVKLSNWQNSVLKRREGQHNGTVYTDAENNPLPYPFIVCGTFWQVRFGQTDPDIEISQLTVVPANRIIRFVPKFQLHADWNDPDKKLSYPERYQITQGIEIDGHVDIDGSFQHNVDDVFGSAGANLPNIYEIDSQGNIISSPEGPYLCISDSAGKIVIVGNFRPLNGSTNAHIARLNADGTLDSSFAPGTSALGFQRTVSITGGTDTDQKYVKLKALFIDNQGRVYVGGNFTNFNGSTPAYHCLMRFASDGTIDTSFYFTFQSSVGHPTINAIYYEDRFPAEVSAEKRILIGGNFTSIKCRDSGYTFYCNNICSIIDGDIDAIKDNILDTTVFKAYSAPNDHLVPANVDATAAAQAQAASVGFNGVVHSILVDDRYGDIYVGGTFTKFDGEFTPTIAKIMNVREYYTHVNDPAP